MPPARVPSIDGETKSPPDHSEYAKYCLMRMSRERYMMHDAPLMQKPYLCTSIEIEVTPDSGACRHVMPENANPLTKCATL